MRTILAIILSVLAIGCGKKDEVISHKPYYENALRATVGVYPNPHFLMPWKEAGCGSGVLLDTGFIITSKHVVDVNGDGFIDQFERTVNIQFFYPERKLVAGRIVFEPVGTWKFGHDFAFISIDNPPPSLISFMDANEYREFLAGDELFAIGLSNGAEPPHITRGIRSTNYAKKLDRASLSIYFGNSGGGIFSEETGKILGIATRVEIDSGAGIVPEWSEYESVATISSVTNSYGMDFLVKRHVPHQSVANRVLILATFIIGFYILIIGFHILWFLLLTHLDKRARIAKK